MLEGHRKEKLSVGIFSVLAFPAVCVMQDREQVVTATKTQ